MMVLFFTATGNNLYIAKRLSNEYYSIPRMIKENTFEFESEKIGIVFPVFHGAVPPIVEEFLNNVTLKSTYIFGIASYGCIAGGASKHLLEIAERNKITFSYINEILMIDNWLPIFNMEKERKRELGKNIEKNLEQIIEDISAKKSYIKRHIAIINFLRQVHKKKFQVSFERYFFTKDNCNQCKTCEKVCPVNNIVVKEKPLFMQNCQQCLSCIHNCPQKAIHLENEKSGERFSNQNVTLNEIIDSNN